MRREAQGEPSDEGPPSQGQAAGRLAWVLLCGGLILGAFLVFDDLSGSDFVYVVAMSVFLLVAKGPSSAKRECADGGSPSG